MLSKLLNEECLTALFWGEGWRALRFTRLAGLILIHSRRLQHGADPGHKLQEMLGMKNCGQCPPWQELPGMSEMVQRAAWD